MSHIYLQSREVGVVFCVEARVGVAQHILNPTSAKARIVPNFPPTALPVARANIYALRLLARFAQNSAEHRRFFDLSHSQPLDENLKAIKISFYKGGTGDANPDWNDSRLTLVKEISGLSKKEIENGITINDLGFGSDDILTFVISIDKSLIPEMATEGEGVGFGHDAYKFNLKLSGTAVPEPAEWAAIFGAIAIAFAAYRRRK